MRVRVRVRVQVRVGVRVRVQVRVRVGVWVRVKVRVRVRVRVRIRVRVRVRARVRVRMDKQSIESLPQITRIRVCVRINALACPASNVPNFFFSSLFGRCGRKSAPITTS